MLQRQTLVIETDLYYGQTYVTEADFSHRDRHIMDRLMLQRQTLVIETDLYYGQTYVTEADFSHRDRLILWTDLCYRGRF